MNQKFPEVSLWPCYPIHQKIVISQNLIAVSKWKDKFLPGFRIHSPYDMNLKPIVTGHSKRIFRKVFMWNFLKLFYVHKLFVSSAKMLLEVWNRRYIWKLIVGAKMIYFPLSLKTLIIKQNLHKRIKVDSNIFFFFQLLRELAGHTRFINTLSFLKNGQYWMIAIKMFCFYQYEYVKSNLKSNRSSNHQKTFTFYPISDSLV